MNRSVGILAYGSLISSPGEEIDNLRQRTIDNIQTPFSVEFARSSKSRGGAPTLVPVEHGGTNVRGKIFVMNASEEDAANALYRREINKVGSGVKYDPPTQTTNNTVLLRRLTNFGGLDVVLYTNISANISPLTAERLAELAIRSVGKTEPNRDGISYLIAAKHHGIVTALSPAYEAHILTKTASDTLEDALNKLQPVNTRTFPDDL